MAYSKDPLENQLLSALKNETAFKALRALMKKPMTVPEIGELLGQKDFARIYHGIDHLKYHGLVKIKEFRMQKNYTKIAVFMPTVKNIIIKIGEETTITTDTKLILHDKGFEHGEE